MIVAAFFMGLNAYCAKMLTGTETFEILFLRSLITILILSAYHQRVIPEGVKIND